MEFQPLHFQPLPGISSPHLQMIITSFLHPGSPPPSIEWRVDLGNGDSLSCIVSTPVHWKQSDPTVVLVHGMGGSHTSSYMIRMSRKFCEKGSKVIRVNLRGCGSGKGLSKLLYHGGTSQDLLKVLEGLKATAPASEIVLIGFSLGGNIALKLAGELGSKAKKFVKTVIAVCTPFDLEEAVQTIQKKRNHFYHFYYLKSIKDQAQITRAQKIRSLYEFDDLITAPPWGYKNAAEYYHDCSSSRYLPFIQQDTHLLFAKDDPFINLDGLQKLSLPNNVQSWVTEKGGHLGFLGKATKAGGIYWMDDLLLNWVEGDFRSNLLI